MKFRKLAPLFVPGILLLAACAPDPQKLLSETGTRVRIVEELMSDPQMRAQVVDRMLRDPESRTALFDVVAVDEQVGGAMIDTFLATDRGKAIAATRIAADKNTTKTVLGMMMLTGEVGDVMDQRQAECLGLGEALAHGNQKRTMIDLRRLGSAVEEWSARNGGAYPVCDRFEDVHGCLEKRMSGALAGLRLQDAWGRPFLYHSDTDGARYTLVSYATDGRYDGLGGVGPTSSYDADIVYGNGGFAQWPGHILRESVR